MNITDRNKNKRFSRRITSNMTTFATDQETLQQETPSANVHPSSWLHFSPSYVPSSPSSYFSFFYSPSPAIPSSLHIPSPTSIIFFLYFFCYFFFCPRPPLPHLHFFFILLSFPSFRFMNDSIPQ